MVGTHSSGYCGRCYRLFLSEYVEHSGHVYPAFFGYIPFAGWNCVCLAAVSAKMERDKVL